MAAQQIDRNGWEPFFDTLTKSLIGKVAEVEVDSLDLGEQIQAEWAPLIGITYDRKDDLIEIALDQLDHLIRHPEKVFADAVAGGVISIEIVDRDGNQQIVKLRDPLALPAPAEARAGASR